MTSPLETGPVETARAAWNGAVPDWVMLLARACAETSQNAVAKRIGRSATLVSNVLRNKYPGDMTAVEEIVRGIYESRTLICPQLGVIGTNDCRDWQLAARSYSPENSLRVTMYRACNRCPRMAGGRANDA